MISFFFATPVTCRTRFASRSTWLFCANSLKEEAIDRSDAVFQHRTFLSFAKAMRHLLTISPQDTQREHEENEEEKRPRGEKRERNVVGRLRSISAEILID